MTDHQGNFNGYLFDLMEAWKKETGIELIYTVTPIKRISMLALNGQIDMVVPDNPVWAAEGYKKKVTVTYSNPVVEIHGGFIRLRDAPDTMKIRERVPVIGSTLGFSHVLIQNDIDEGRVVIHEVAHATSLMGLLRANRVDSIFGAVPSLIKLGNQSIGNGSVMQDKSLPEEFVTYHLSAAKNHEQVLRFNQWLEKKSTRKKLQSLRKKWGL